MTVAYKASASGNTSVVVPASTAAGDLLLMTTYTASSSPQTAPSGWSSLTSVPNTSDGNTLWVFYKFAVSGDAGSTVTTASGANPELAVFSGVPNNSAAIAAYTTTTATATQITLPTESPSPGGGMLVGVVGSGAATNVLAPTGWTSTSAGSAFYGRAFAYASSAPSSWAFTLQAGSSAMEGATITLGVYFAPDAPTNLTPSGTTVDRTITQRVNWTYSNTNPSDTQSAFDLQWRHQGTTDAWNTVSQTTPNAYWDAPGGTFPAEGIEYQVRTYDQGGLVSPWSALTTFTAADPTGTPTITSPTSGGTITTTPTTVDWSANTQQAYQVRTVADNAGVADTATVYYDSGQVTDANARSLAVPFSTNNITEHIQVRVEQNSLWSSWADITVTVSYTAPATPTLVASPDSTAGTITVTPTQPTPSGGEPTVASMDVWCRTAATSSTTDPQRPKTTGTRLAAGVSPTAAWVDYAPASGVEYEYQIVANGSNSTTSSSAWTA